MSDDEEDDDRGYGSVTSPRSRRRRGGRGGGEEEGVSGGDGGGEGGEGGEGGANDDDDDDDELDDVEAPYGSGGAREDARLLGQRRRRNERRRREAERRRGGGSGGDDGGGRRAGSRRSGSDGGWKRKSRSCWSRWCPRGCTYGRWRTTLRAVGLALGSFAAYEGDLKQYPLTFESSASARLVWRATVYTLVAGGVAALADLALDRRHGGGAGQVCARARMWWFKNGGHKVVKKNSSSTSTDRLAIRRTFLKMEPHRTRTDKSLVFRALRCRPRVAPADHALAARPRDLVADRRARVLRVSHGGRGRRRDVRQTT